MTFHKECGVCGTEAGIPFLPFLPFLPFATTYAMRIEERDDFIDQVAQAVIDRIEERDRVSGLVESVVQRVIQMQRDEAALRAVAQAQATDSETDGGVAPAHDKPTEETHAQ